MTEPMETTPSEKAPSSHPYEVANHKLIYAFSRDDTPKLQGKLKVGDASIPAREPADYSREELEAAADRRILSYTGTANVTTELRYVEAALKHRKPGEPPVGFRDYDVHRILLNSGYTRYIDENPKLTGREWFDDITPEDVAAAVEAVKEDQDFISSDSSGSSIKLYPHQQAAVEESLGVLSKGTVDNPKKMLWNAKMRFGKTLAAYSFIHEAPDVSRVLVITHRPDVNSSWFEDFQKFGLHRHGWRYGSKRNGNSFQDLVEKDSFGVVSPISDGLVWFASMQDLRLSGFGKDVFDKNDEIFSMEWDLVITDEAHEGTTTELAGAVFESLKSSYFLDLSGTPYNILAAGEWDITGAGRYIYDGVYNWSYMDEQKAKREWPSNHFDEPNPYEVFPEVEFRTYDVDGILSGSISQANPDYRVSEFLRTDGKGNFIYEQSVLDLLRKLQGDRLYNSIAPDSFPYHNSYNWMFRHTLWILPSVDAVTAMQNLLARSDSGFGGFKVVNATGLGNADASGTSALERVREAVKGEAPSITLSFRMLTTGISVPEWTAVFMMNSATSAMAYMQTAFRAATPYVFPNGSQKAKAYIFDFNVDRSLSAIVEAAKASVPSSAATSPVEYDRAVREAVDSFLEYAPVLSMSEAHFVAPNSSRILEKINEAYLSEAVEQGFSSPRMLHAPSLRNFDIKMKDVLNKLREIQGSAAKRSDEVVLSELSEEMREKLKERQKELNAQKEAGEPPLTADEKQELKEGREKLDSDRKVEAKNRKNAVSILTGILCRLPMLVLAARTEQEIEPGSFNELIDEASWREFMPSNLIRIKPEGVGSLEDRKDAALGDEGSELYWDDIVTFFDPVIFTGACERVRKLARDSDEKAPADRAIRVASMFSFFKNPDKETVLTPWRVVNLQYVSTVGGLCSVDLERSTAKDTYLFVEAVETGELQSLVGRSALAAVDSGTHRFSPVWLDPGRLSPEAKERLSSILAEHGESEGVDDDLSELPSGVVVPSTRAELRAQNSGNRRAVDLWAQDKLSVYDINSKTALYPLFAALSRFYIRSLEVEDRGLPQHGDRFVESSLPLELQQEIWREVIEENIFVNCRVDYSRSIAQRVLMGFDPSQEVNATVVDVLELKGALEWWNSGGDVEPPKKNARKASYMPDWWKEIDDVYDTLGAILRLANGGFLRYHRDLKLRLQLSSAKHSDERFQQLLETVLLSKSQGEEQSMGKKSDERSAERLNAVRELLEIVDAAKDLPRFDLTAGNPPYSFSSEGMMRSDSIYHHFMLTAKNISDYVSLIYPSRWMFGGAGEGLDRFAEEEANSENYISFFDFSDSSAIFAPPVSVAGGINFFLWSSLENDRELVHYYDWNKSTRKTLASNGLFRDSSVAEIVSKLGDGPRIEEIVSSRVYYGPEVSNYASAKKILLEGSGTWLYVVNQGKGVEKVEVDYSGTKETLDWKVAVSKTAHTNSSSPYARADRIFLAEPGSILSDSFLKVGSFVSREEAINCLRYLKTDLANFLLGVITPTQNTTKKNYRLIPRVDFSSGRIGDTEDYLDFSNPEELDDQLSAFYGFTIEQVGLISSGLKHWKNKIDIEADK